MASNPCTGDNNGAAVSDEGGPDVLFRSHLASPKSASAVAAAPVQPLCPPLSGQDRYPSIHHHSQLGAGHVTPLSRQGDVATRRRPQVRFSSTPPPEEAAPANVDKSTHSVPANFIDIEDVTPEELDDSSLTGSSVLEPYSGLAGTSGGHISQATQVLALLQRTGRQLLRQRWLFLAEVLAPLLFVVLLIVLDIAFGAEAVKEKVFVDPQAYSPMISSEDYRTYLCYNDSAYPIQGLYPCRTSRQIFLCDGDESGIPVSGLCYLAIFNNPTLVVTQYLNSFMGTAIALPKLDSIIVHQWMAKKAGLAASSRSRTALGALANAGLGVSSVTRFDSISYSGLLYFAPAANVPATLLAYFRNVSAMFDYVFGGVFATVEEANTFLRNDAAEQESINSSWGLIIINDITDSFDVEVQLHGAALPAMKPPVSVFYRGSFTYDGTDMYLASGFVTLQRILSDYFYENLSARGALAGVTSGAVSPFTSNTTYSVIASYPTIAVKMPYLLTMASSLAAFVMVLAFLYPFAQVTKRIVLEKELRIQESMCIMGLKRSSLWLSFFIVTCLEFLLIAVLLTIVVCVFVAKRSNPFAVFLILFVYAMSLIPLSGLVSVFFGQARMAALISPLVYFVMSMPIFAISAAQAPVLIGLSLLSPTGLASLLTSVFSAEAGNGFRMGDFKSPYFPVPPYAVMIILAGDTVLYLLLMFYLDAVMPKEWGMCQHPLFFLLRPYAWLKARWESSQSGRRGAVLTSGEGANQRKSGTTLDGMEMSLPEDVSTLTQERVSAVTFSTAPGRSSITPPDLGIKRGQSMEIRAAVSTETPARAPRTCGIDPNLGRDVATGQAKEVSVRVDGVCKYFKRGGRRFAATDHLSWDLYRGEIAVLLGPNGAGKSTAINMITGMLPADRGDCFIEGFSMRHNVAEARHHIGYCPQHNILWSDLTCGEHLEFYGKIKGLRGAPLEDAVVDVLRAVDLEEKRDVLPCHLSGGQKRKLSVAIAFVGRNRVVLLDEPTAGMDAAARRHTWSLLRAMAEHQTILLTTHYMDEADLLGDNVAIVADGVLQCVGSTVFLRQYAGVSYSLRFDLSPMLVHADDVAARQVKIEAVWAKLHELVLAHLPDATLVLQTDAEVEYELQLRTEDRLPALLRTLESYGNTALKVRGYALRAPTLEDVFLRVVEHHIEPEAAARQTERGPSPSVAGQIRTEENASFLMDYTNCTVPYAAQEEPSPGGRNDVRSEGVRIPRKGKRKAPLQSSDPLRMTRRLSRASLRYVNNEAVLPYGSTAPETSEEEEELIAAVTSDLLAQSGDQHGRAKGRQRGLTKLGGRDDVPMDQRNERYTADSSAQLRNALEAFKFSFTVGSKNPSRSLVTPALPVFPPLDTTAAPKEEPAMMPLFADPNRRDDIDAHPEEALPPSGKSELAGAPSAHFFNTPCTAAEASTLPAAAAAAADPVYDPRLTYKHVTDLHLDEVWATQHTTGWWSLAALQLYGMLYKRLFTAIRDSRMLFFQIVCPVFCILLAMLLQLVKAPSGGNLVLSPSAFEVSSSMQVSGCAGFMGIPPAVTAGRGDFRDLSFIDPNFQTSNDMSLELLDTWFTHDRARFMSMQCQDPLIQALLQMFYPAALQGRTVSVLLYNTSSRQSLPIAAHTASALALLAALGNGTAAQVSMTYSMQVSTLSKTESAAASSGAIASILIGVIVLIPFTFLPANPVAWVVKEYESRARHLQAASGLQYLIYWLGNLIFDFLAYALSIALILIIFLIFDRKEYIGSDTVGATIVSFAVYGVCYCCCSYFVSFAFAEHTNAQMVVLGASFLTGFLCVMLVFVLSLMNKTTTTSNTLRWFFRAIPPYAIGEVILNLALLEQKQVQDPTLTAWSPSITVWPDIYMAVETPIFAALTLLLDHPNRRAVVDRVKSFVRGCCRFCCRHRMVDGEEQHSRASPLPELLELPLQQRRLCGSIRPRRASSDAAAEREGGLSGGDAPAGTPCHRNVCRSPVFALSPELMAGDTHRDEHRAASVKSDGDVISPICSPVSPQVPNPMWGGILKSSMTSPPRAPGGTLAHVGNPVRGVNYGLPAVLTSPRRSDVAESEIRTRVCSFPGVAVPSRNNPQKPPLATGATSRDVRAEEDVPGTTKPRLFYTAPQWSDVDAQRLRDEDEDVKEERGVVYRTERQYLAGGNGHAGKAVTGKSTASEAHGDGVPSGQTTDPPLWTRDVIRVVDLRKVYDDPHKVAVSALNFSVMHGEVFGFLGTNGAGKSTALSIITQEQLPTSGRAYVCGHDVVRESRRAAGCVGYCPQFDACLDLLSVTEHLRLYAMVRGVLLSSIDRLITNLLFICNLTAYRHVRACALSGGNRRKLSVALALIGSPKVVCLDEPTAGMDPLARQLLWRALDRVSQKCAIVLTTHHLEEVEALADCVGIMVDGGLRCLGDLTHLKQKYARNAYELTLRVRRRGPAAGGPCSPQHRQRVSLPTTVFDGSRTPHPPSHNRRVSSAYGGSHLIDNSDDIFQFMLRTFPSAILIDTFNNERYVYTLPATRDVANAMQQLWEDQQQSFLISSFAASRLDNSFRRGSVGARKAPPIVRLSEVFEALQAVKDRLGITEYSVSQVSLEQVFMKVCTSTEAPKRGRHRSFAHSDVAVVASGASIRQSASIPSHPGALIVPSSSLCDSPGRGIRSCRSGSIRMAKRPSVSLLPDLSNTSCFFHPARKVSTSQGQRLTFAEYRRQRAMWRFRVEEETPQLTPAEQQRLVQPDHDLSP